MEKFPQVMVNVNVSPEGKIAFYSDPCVRAATEHAKNELGQEGRIVIAFPVQNRSCALWSRGVISSK